jgi:hypothetical protein
VRAKRGKRQTRRGIDSPDACRSLLRAREHKPHEAAPINAHDRDRLPLAPRRHADLVRTTVISTRKVNAVKLHQFLATTLRLRLPTGAAAAGVNMPRRTRRWSAARAKEAQLPTEGPTLAGRIFDWLVGVCHWAKQRYEFAVLVADVFVLRHRESVGRSRSRLAMKLCRICERLTL